MASPGSSSSRPRTLQHASAEGSARLPRGLERFTGVVLLFAAWQIALQLRVAEPERAGRPVDRRHVGWDMIRDGSARRRPVDVAAARAVGHGDRHR